MKEPFGYEYDSDHCECGYRRGSHAKGGPTGDGCTCATFSFSFKARDLFQSLSQEEFDALEGPSEDEMRDAMERGWRETSWGLAYGPRRRLPEDD